MSEHFGDMIREADDFLVGKSKVHRTLERLQHSMREAGVGFALAGALAVGERGHLRLTVDVEVLVTASGLRTFRDRWLGRGYTEKFPGARGVRDGETGVPIDFLVAGEFPGDGKPKPVRFPDPQQIAPDPTGLRILDLRTLIELELAAGQTAPERLQDLADVVALVRANRLPADYAASLDASVRDKFAELWQAAQGSQRDL